MKLNILSLPTSPQGAGDEEERSGGGREHPRTQFRVRVRGGVHRLQPISGLFLRDGPEFAETFLVIEHNLFPFCPHPEESANEV